MYALIRRESIDPVPAQEGHPVGFGRYSLVGGAAGSVHMGLGLASLRDGYVDEHLHSFEESFYVLEGEPVIFIAGRGVRLRPGACGVVPVGVPHAWRSDGGATWIDMFSPRPRTAD